MIRLWIDDERTPPVGEWIWARSFEAAEILLRDANKLADITRISFDHDLGYDKNGYDLACILEEADRNGLVHPGIVCTVHSANPVGAKRIAHVLEKITGDVWQYHIRDYIRLCHDEEESLGGRAP